jgi:hypothetical protein
VQRPGRDRRNAPAGARIADVPIVSSEQLQARRCAYCGKVLEVNERLVVLVPNRPIRRVRCAPGEELPVDGMAVHERCYEERERSVDGGG